MTTIPPLSTRAIQSPELASLQLARTSRWLHRLAKILCLLLPVSLASLVLVPWQQSVLGTGRVITYDPIHRTQEVDAPISGRIVNIREGLVEGTRVHKGDLLMEIEVIDPMLRFQLDEQMAATRRKLETEKTIVEAYVQQVEAAMTIRDLTIASQDGYVKSTREKLQAEEQKVIQAEAAYDQAEKDRLRRKELFEKKVESRYEWELSERKAAEEQAKLKQSRFLLESARTELSAKMAERDYKIREADAKIDSVRAIYEKSKGDVASSEKEIADIKGKQTLQVQAVTAPIDGFVLRLMGFQGGTIVSAGRPLLELVPATIDRAVEIKIHGNDVPLAASRNADGTARKVRLQFEGWPAVQFSGWPSVAVGTFGGRIAVVDSTDDGMGKFRVLVLPDPDDPHEWPTSEVLRQGVRVNGWVLLDKVLLGQELWRQLNGFPPVVSSTEQAKFKEDKLLRGKK